MAVQVRILQASVLCLAGLVLLSAGAYADADTGDAGLEPIIDVSGYPTPLPVGCPEGAAALVAITFSNGIDPPQSEFSEVSLGAGDTVTMRWDRFAPGCLDSNGNPTIAVTLAAHRALQGHFDPAVDQPLATWSSCGDGAPACTEAGGANTLRLAIPPPTFGCFFQLDAILGRPLAFVGPGGSFYSAIMRGSGPSMLIGAVGVDIPNCASVSSTTTTLPPTTTVPTTLSPTTTAPTTTAPTTTAPTTTAPQTTTTIATVVKAVMQSTPSLAITGATTGRSTSIAGGFIIAGMACLFLAGAIARPRFAPATAERSTYSSAQQRR